MGRPTTQNKKDQKFPKCGKTTRSGKPCQNVAGKATDHFGTGPCYIHGGDTPEVHGRWSVMRRETIKRRLTEMQSRESDYLDLQEDLQLMRALTLDYIDRYDEVTEALIAWNNSFDEVFTDSQRRFQRALKNGNPEEVKKRLEELERTWYFVQTRKPRKVQDLAEAVSLVEKCSRVVERIQKIRMMKSLSLMEANRLMVEMALIVSEVIRDDEAVERITSRWEKIRVKRAPKEIAAKSV